MTEPVGHPRSHGLDALGAESSPSSSPGLDRSVSEAAERIEAIIDAATRVASEIRADGEAEADRYLEEAERKADRLDDCELQVQSPSLRSLLPCFVTP